MNRRRTGGGRFNIATLEPPHEDILIIEVTPALDTLRKAELMALAKDAGLKVTGTKQDLIDRLGA